jgi:hypothetical protein
MERNSEQEQRLELLAELLNTGRLTESDYLRARVSVLKGEPPPADIILTRVYRADAEPLAPSVGELTTVDPQSRERRLRQIEKQRDEDGVSRYRPSQSLFGDPNDSGKFSTVSSGLELGGASATLSVIEDARQRRRDTRYGRPAEAPEHTPSILVPILAFTGIGLVGLALMSSSLAEKRPTFPPAVSSGAQPMPTFAPSKRTPVMPSSPAAPRQAKTTQQAALAFVPLFGPEAQTECVAACTQRQNPAKTSCARACLRLSLEEYARRITLTDRTPQLDAQKITSRCLIAAESSSSSVSQVQWRESITQALATLAKAPARIGGDSYGSLRSLYTESSSIANNLSLPENGGSEEKVLTEKTRQASCLRANLALTEIALALSQQRQDDFSKRFYVGLHKALKPVTLDVEGSLLMNARKAGLIK